MALTDRKYVIVRHGLNIHPDIRNASTYVVYKSGSDYGFANLIFTVEAERADEIYFAFMALPGVIACVTTYIEIVARIVFTGTNLQSSYTKFIWENREMLETLIPEFVGTDGLINYIRSIGEIRTLYLDNSITYHEIFNRLSSL